MPIKVYIAAARSPPRSERANSHALPPRAIQRGLSGRDIHVPPFGVAGPALDRQRRDHHRPWASRVATDAMGRSSAGKNPQSRSAELTDERGPRFVDLLMLAVLSPRRGGGVRTGRRDFPAYTRTGGPRQGCGDRRGSLSEHCRLFVGLRRCGSRCSISGLAGPSVFSMRLGKRHSACRSAAASAGPV